jgi:DNA repair photolyase
MCEHTFVRWDNLTIEAQEGTALPGYREPAVVRHFDAPEALDTRFYEVRAKSALNRVPERSRMPFRWTINPYRGCAHACTFCMGPETPILMADGRTRSLADLAVGDAIVGTEMRGRYRRYVTTEVLAHWSTIKPAYRVTLEDGTDLIASADHRFLTVRGWKFVTGAYGGPKQRPHLTTNNELLGTGQFVAGPVRSSDYKRGYLCGMIRGDGHIGSSVHLRADGTERRSHRFRLALADLEALRRADEFLLDGSVYTTPSIFTLGGGGRRAMLAISSTVERRIAVIEELIRWPLSPNEDWRKGFLAGIFDAEGSCAGQALRITNKNRLILGWIAACLGHFGFDHVEEPPRPDGVTCIRIRGGLRERLRFFHLTDPAITRKRTVQGIALKSDAKTRVASVEPLGMAMRLYDITTGSGDFIANGVVSHNCFARPTHTYLDFDAGRDFEKEIVVKVNAPEVLRVELARPSWKREHIAMGTNTDPYQWVEGRYKLMRGIWEALRDAANPCSVLTKSPLLLRDLDLMKQIAQVTDISANLSVPTIDEKAWRASEPHTPNPRARLEAVGELNRAGIPTGVLVAPLMPGINDDPAQVEEILQAAADAGATGVSGIGLHLRGEVRGIFMEWLRSYRPDLVERYEELYARGAYLPRVEQERIGGLIRRARVATRAPRFGAFRREPGRDYEAMGPPDAGAERPPRPPEQEQTKLF